MNPEQIDERKKALEQIDTLMKTYQISPQELHATAMAPQEPIVTKPEERKHLTVAETLYNVGAIVILAGAWALVAINWGSLEGVGKVLSSLSVVILTYLLAVGLSRVKQLETVAPSLFLATVATIPVVVIALFDALELGVSGASSMFLIALISGLISLAGWLIHRIPLFILGVIVYATFAYTASLQMFADTLPKNFQYRQELAVAEFVFLGLVYCLLVFLSTKYIKSLSSFTNALYGFGSLFILAALFTQTGWSSSEVTIVGLIYPLVVLLGVIASALLKQPSILAVTTIFLIIYIVKTTFMYFSDNLGWPITLMLSGLLTIAIGIGANLLAKRLGLTKSKI